MTQIAAAFLPLTDCAPLIVARELGFAEKQGVDLRLVRDTSWATVRDRLVYGQVQAAHMLAPLAVAVTLGLSQTKAAIAAPFKLNDNGNALTLSTDFAAALDPAVLDRVRDPIATAFDFAGAIGLHRRKPVIGVVHRYSSHALMLRYWLGHAGVNPDRDISLRVLPPSLMTGALRSGEIDGFSAGEPWSSVAVAEGLGEIAAVGVNIWQRGVEKVLALREDWMEANPDPTDRLIVALDAACAWCDDPTNRAELADLLAQPNYVAQPAELILPALSHRMQLRPGGAPMDLPNFVMFHRDATNFPWRSQALWIYSQFVRWGMAQPSKEAEQAASNVFRSDIYRRALAGSGAPMPGASLKVEGSLAVPLDAGNRPGQLMLGPDRFFDGLAFDPDKIPAYLNALKTRRDD